MGKIKINDVTNGGSELSTADLSTEVLTFYHVNEMDNRPYAIHNNRRMNTVSMCIALNEKEMERKEELLREINIFFEYEITEKEPDRFDLKNAMIEIGRSKEFTIAGYIYFNPVPMNKHISEYYPSLPESTINSILSPKYEGDENGNIVMSNDNCKRIADEVMSIIPFVMNTKLHVLTSADLAAHRNKYR